MSGRRNSGDEIVRAAAGRPIGRRHIGILLQRVAARSRRLLTIRTSNPTI